MYMRSNINQLNLKTVKDKLNQKNKKIEIFKT